jgi:serine phosphatase RsbU (regulator of sigma subunit)
MISQLIKIFKMSSKINFVKTLKYFAILSLMALAQIAYSQKPQAKRNSPVPLTPKQEETVKFYLDKSTRLETEEKDLKEASRFLNDAALIYWENFQYQKAVNLYEKSAALNATLGNLSGLSMLQNNLGMIYSDLSDYTKSLDYFQKTLEHRRKTNEKLGMISALVNCSVVLNNLKRYDESIKYLEEATALAKEINDVEQIRMCYGLLSETYEKNGNSEKSIYYFNFYRSLNDLISNEKVAEAQRSTEEAQLKNLQLEVAKRDKELELYRKQQEVEQEHEKNSALYKNLSKTEVVVELLKKETELKKLEAARQEEKFKQERMIKNIAIGGIAFFVLLLGFVIKSFFQKKKDNKLLGEQNTAIREQQSLILEKNDALNVAYTDIAVKNTQITDSINYASRIQSSMLNKHEGLQKYIPQSFIFFQPKQVVSGDFYWYAEIDKKIIVAAVDCTGHGVPGAFMSLIGSNLMNSIVEQQRVTSPAEILKRLHSGVNKALNQTLTDNKDGMDAAICTIDKEKKSLLFSGAHNPLVLINNGEMNFFKGSRQSVGGKEEQKSFDEIEIPFQAGARFYLYSDGYEDQFGGKDDRKFTSKKFKELLFEIHTKPMDEQGELIKKTINAWKEGYKQIDDILVMGGLIES